MQDVWVHIFLTALALASAALVGVGVKVPGWLAVAGAVAAVSLALSRNTWLPFLGRTALPSSLFKASSPADASETMTLVATKPDTTRIVYWGADRDAPDPQAAYRGFNNAGVATVVAGKAVLRLRCPGKYEVHGRRLARHVHWREVNDSGMLSEVKTAAMLCIP